MPAEAPTMSTVDPPDMLGLIREWILTRFDDNWLAWAVGILILWTQWMLFFWGFYEAYRSARKTGKRFWSTIQMTIGLRIRHLRRLTLPQRIIVVLAGLSGIAVQAFWAVTTYITACVMDELARANFGGEESVGMGFIKWNWFTGSYTLVCILLLLTTHTTTIPWDAEYALQAVLAALLPTIIGIVTGILALLVTLLSALLAVLNWISTLGNNWGEIDWLEVGGAWIVPIGMLLYVALTFGSFRTVAATANTWRRFVKDAPPAADRRYRG